MTLSSWSRSLRGPLGRVPVPPSRDLLLRRLAVAKDCGVASDPGGASLPSDQGTLVVAVPLDTVTSTLTRRPVDLVQIALDTVQDARARDPERPMGLLDFTLPICGQLAKP
jgi:hypothetical protein